MIFNPCLDDSGSDQWQPNFILGGYIASAESWIRFSDEWQEMLDLPPKIRHFKLKEAVRLKDEFRPLENPRAGDLSVRFTEALRDERVRIAFSLIRKYALGGIVHVAPSYLYEEFVKGKVSPDLDDPYVWAFLDVTLGLAALQKFRFKDDVFDFVFDYQSVIGDIAAKWFRTFKNFLPEEHRNHLGDPIFRHDINFLPLQAADTLAWLMRRRHADEFRGIRLPTELITGLLGGVKMVHAVTWNREKFDYVLKQLSPAVRSDLSAWKGKMHEGGNALTEYIDRTKLSPVRLSDLMFHDGAGGDLK